MFTLFLKHHFHSQCENVNKDHAKRGSVDNRGRYTGISLFSWGKWVMIFIVSNFFYLFFWLKDWFLLRGVITGKQPTGSYRRYADVFLTGIKVTRSMIICCWALPRDVVKLPHRSWWWFFLFKCNTPVYIYIYEPGDNGQYFFSSIM